MAFSYSASSQIVILAGFAEERGLSHAQVCEIVNIGYMMYTELHHVVIVICNRYIFYKILYNSNIIQEIDNILIF